MTGIVIPEVIIYNTLKTIINLIKKDIESNEFDENTILYSLFIFKNEYENTYEAVRLNSHNFFAQTKAIFNKKENLNVFIGYNTEVNKQTCNLHIILPSETAIPSAIGQDEGYMETSTTSTLTQGFNSMYQVMITSDNSIETMLVYHVLKSMMILLSQQIDLLGLRNPSFSGSDVMMKDDSVPVPLFHKVLNISFGYDLTVPKLELKQFMKSFLFEYRLVDYFQTTDEQI